MSLKKNYLLYIMDFPLHFDRIREKIKVNQVKSLVKFKFILKNLQYGQKIFKKVRLGHSFHLVEESGWPLYTSVSVTTLLAGAVLYMHSYVMGYQLFLIGLVATFYTIVAWGYDVFLEGTIGRYHTKSVRIGLRFGFKLFIVSEIMFFFSFFWAYFHVALAPAFDLGWPSKGIIPWGLNYYVSYFDLKEASQEKIYFLNERSFLTDNFVVKTVIKLLKGDLCDFLKEHFGVFFYNGHKTNLLELRYILISNAFIEKAFVKSAQMHMNQNGYYSTLLVKSETLDVIGDSLEFFKNSTINKALIITQRKWLPAFTWGSAPLLNTIILLTSGASITWSHLVLRARGSVATSIGLMVTIFFGIIFTYTQYKEYLHLPFGINDGIYGSIFYLTTGFHGLHVLIGTILLIINLVKNGYHLLDKKSHVGFQGAIWYWHFVDVVWIFLFICVYVWGGVQQIPELIIK